MLTLTLTTQLSSRNFSDNTMSALQLFMIFNSHLEPVFYI
jgi:hypothetical protein